MNKFIKVHKNVLPIESKKNIVYQISYKDCNATYVRQTGRKLKTRISEHKNHINRNTTPPISNHIIDCITNLIGRI